jgi:hypothetical protein
LMAQQLCLAIVHQQNIDLVVTAHGHSSAMQPHT